MLLDLIKLDKNSKRPMYLQIGDELIKAVRERKIHPGDPLPSVREIAKELSISMVTAEKALKRLSLNGYITTLPKKGSFISKLAVSTGETPFDRTQKAHQYKFNFAENSIDIDLFPFAELRKSLYKASRQMRSLNSYGETQGQKPLRDALSHNIYQNRGVICTPNQILIGGGLQCLLPILIDLLDEITNRQVAFVGEPVLHASWMFQKRKWEVSSFAPADLDSVTADVIYMNSKTSDQQLRTGLLAWLAKDPNRYVIEDDYDAEFRAAGKDAASLQGLSLDGNVIYYGSFSRLLTPALRVSFFVLPTRMMIRFKTQEKYYVQSSSILEQLALADFIGNGNFNRHLRRIKRANHAKSEFLAKQLKDRLPQINISRSTNGTALILKFPHKLDKAKLESLLAQEKVLLPPDNISGNTVRLGITGLGSNKVSESARTLARVFTKLSPKK